MPDIFLLDTGPLGLYAHSNGKFRRPIHDWVKQVTIQKGLVYIPEVTDYELRRKLTHMVITGRAPAERLDRLNDLTKQCTFLPVSSVMWKRAAQLWAELRKQGLPSTDENALDVDVLLAAQALEVNGTVVTMNTRHFAPHCPVLLWPQP
jgi:predicted nucleic acid-binding protein